MKLNELNGLKKHLLSNKNNIGQETIILSKKWIELGSRKILNHLIYLK